MDLVEIWHRDGPRGGKVLGVGFAQYLTHPTLGPGCIKGVCGASGASTVHFGEIFIKQIQIRIMLISQCN